MFWNWHVSSRILWWEHLKALSKVLPIFGLYQYLGQRHRVPQQDTEVQILGPGCACRPLEP